MRKISKLLVGILFSALVMAPSYAGEMTVTGGATATYSIGGDSSGSGKTLGISNELDFTASGELDNGYTWKYQVQLDGATTANDDTRLEIGTDMGTVGFYISEGGMRKSLHGVGALGSGFDYHSPASGTSGAFQTGYNVDGYSNIQYHSPADMLPFGLKIGLGYVPDMKSLDMGASVLAPLVVPAEDRNRTSPFPYGGHRFEFRAVGSAQNVSIVNTVLATITATVSPSLSAAIVTTASATLLLYCHVPSEIIGISTPLLSLMLGFSAITATTIPDIDMLALASPVG